MTQCAGPTPLKNIAVVAVHGVGLHDAGTTAEAIAHLLLGVSDGDASRYTSFRQEPINVPTRPLKLDCIADTNAPAPKGRFEERSRLTRERIRQAEDPAKPPSDLAFMQTTLEGYEPRSEPGFYETVRFSGQRLDTKIPVANVHVYEMFWSDIASIGNRFWSVFTDFYQIIIHLPYIGQQTLDLAYSDEGPELPKKMWNALRVAHTTAMRVFTAGIPTLNILLFALGLALVPIALPHGQRQLAALLPALTTMALLVYLQSRKADRLSVLAAVMPVVAATAVGVGVFLVLPLDEPIVSKILVIEWWILAALPLYIVFQGFERNRPGVFGLAVVLYTALTIVLLVVANRKSDFDASAFAKDHLATAGAFLVLRGAEYLYVALYVTWFVFMTAALAAIALGPFAGTNDRLKRASYTSDLTLLLPATLFIVATLLTWGAVYEGAAQRLLPATHYTPAFTYPALQLRAHADTVAVLKDTKHSAAYRDSVLTSIQSASYFPRAFDGVSASRTVLVAAGACLLAVLLLIWGIAPSAAAELKPPPTIPVPKPDAPTQKSTFFGSWLDIGLKGIWLGGPLIALALLTCWVTALLLCPYPPGIHWWHADIGGLPSVLGALHIGGLAIASGAVGYLALTKRFSTIGLGFRPVLAIILDVDVYLRQLPRSNAPRARIVERLASLFRYLCVWKADDGLGPGYDAIVIIAHSQGSVITADFLRYLDKCLPDDGGENERDLARCLRDRSLPLYFLTMGAPLHQLYARRFPHLYRWITSAAPDAPSDTPDPNGLLGVRKWVNAYRSGDYVGRAIWSGEREQAYVPGKTQLDGTFRRELCVGPGGHLHYWDSSATAIGTELDTLIATKIMPVL